MSITYDTDPTAVTPPNEVRVGDWPATEVADAPRRPKMFEGGVLLVVVGAPLVFLPMSTGPFVDLKVVVVIAGSLAMWAGAPSVDRQLAAAATLWVGVAAVAGFFGVDRWWSLVGVENLSGGMLLLGPCACLLVSGAAMPASLARRLPNLLLAVAVPISILATIWRFAPGAVDAVVPDLSFAGSTLGHPVFVSGFCMVALLAAVGARVKSRAWFVLALIVVATALSLSTRRVGLVAFAFGLAITWWRARQDRGRVLRIGVVVLGVLVGWAVLDIVGGPSAGLSAAPRFGELGSDSARAHVVIQEVLLRAWMDRPVLGWGPGATWSAYLSDATEEEVAIAGRGVADAHDLVLGTAVTSGAVGLAALLYLGWGVGRRARRGPPALAWAVGTTTGLLIFHLLQPVSAPLTPLLFLMAGVSASQRAGCAVSTRARGRVAVGILLAGGLVLSTSVLASSVLEQWGRTYNSQWSLRAAQVLAPGRVTGITTLAIYRAQDAGVDPTAAAEARDLVDALVRDHPSHPGVRMVGMSVELILNEPERARVWLARQVAVFPGDLASFPEGMVRFLRTGEPPDATTALQAGITGGDEID